MKEICIPIPYLKEKEIAEVEVLLAGKKIQYDFRVESFPWEEENEFSTLSDPLEQSLARIYRLKSAIDGYDKDWELIQIFNPDEHADHIHVLYRKKMKIIIITSTIKNQLHEKSSIVFVPACMLQALYLYRHKKHGRWRNVLHMHLKIIYRSNDRN